MNELQAEVEEQAALKEQDMTEAEKSVKWKKLQKEFKEHYKMKGKAGNLMRRTKDEKDVHTMLENFEEKVGSLNPPDLTQAELKTAEELQIRLANAKPEEIPDIQEQMKKMADEARAIRIAVFVSCATEASGRVVLPTTCHHGIRSHHTPPGHPVASATLALMAIGVLRACCSPQARRRRPSALRSRPAWPRAACPCGQARAASARDARRASSSRPGAWCPCP